MKMQNEIEKLDIQWVPGLCVAFAATLWAVDGVVLRPELFSLPATLVVFIESSIVAISMTLLFRKRFKFLKYLQPGDWLAFLGVAFLGGVVGTVTITQALFYVHFVNLSIVVLIQKLQPVFALILAAIFLKERLQPVFFRWAALALLGAYLMTFGAGTPDLATGDKTLIAALLALIAAFCFAASTVLSKRALRNVDFVMGTYLRFSIAAGVLGLTVLSTGDFSSVGIVTLRQTAIFFLIAITTGGPAIFIYYYGLKRIKASVATICEMAFPLSALLFEYLLRGNVLGPVQWAGMFMLLVSIFFVTRLPQSRDDSQGNLNKPDDMPVLDGTPVLE